MRTSRPGRSQRRESKASSSSATSTSSARPAVPRLARRELSSTSRASAARRCDGRRLDGAGDVIVRWSLDELPAVLDELGVARPLLVASKRWSKLDLPHVARWTEIPSDRIDVPPEADSLLAVGGGSAIDTAHYASSQAGLPVVSVPTTYSGAEGTPSFGVRSRDRHIVGGGGGADPAAVVYHGGLAPHPPPAAAGGTAVDAAAP